MAEERRILVVKLSSLGDTLHALPAVAELRDRLPATVDWAVQPAFAPLVRAFACVDRVFEVPRPARPREWARALSALRREPPWDLVVDFQGLLKSALVARAARAPRRIGPSFAREGSRLLYTEIAGRRDKSRHAIDECFDVLRHLGIPVPAEPRFPLSVPVPDPDALDPPELASLSGPRVAVAPYSRWPSKNWPAERFAEAIRLLVQERGARVHVLGGPGDRAGAQAILDAAGVPAANHCGAFSLVESAGLLSRCEALLTNDSGPMHLAAALGVRCVALFGPTSAARTGPYGPRHAILRAEPECPRAPCRRRVCPLGAGACLASIPAARAVAALFEPEPRT